MRLTPRLYVLLALLLLVGIWFYASLEWVTERENVGFSGEAARNPLLAFKRLCERLGAKVAAGKRGDDRFDATATVVLPNGRREYARPQAERLVAWVKAGGHLIVEAEPVDRRDDVLDAFGVARSEVPGERSQPAVAALPESQPRRVTMHPAMNFVPGERGASVHRATDSHGTLVFHQTTGAGRLTVLPSFEFLRNASIGEHDNAEFAWDLVRLMPATSSIVIAPLANRLSMLRWLAQNARAALAAAAVVLLLWMWRAATRFGPIEPDPVGERRRLLDHLRASGRYLWRAGAAARLIASARESCLQKIARRRPELAELPVTERAERLAALTELPARDIEAAWSDKADTPAAFTAAVSTLQAIDEKLTRKPTV
jgi:hypothetical protein